MDTSKPYSDTIEIEIETGDRDSISPLPLYLLLYLPLYLHRRDRALSLPRAGARTLSLVEYHNRQTRAAATRLAEAAFCKALIDECRKEVTRLIGSADTPEKRRVILPEVERLNVLAEGAAAEMEGMTDG